MMRYSVREDEREAMVSRNGDRLAWLVLSFGLLGSVAWRAFADGDASWDLLGLVVLSGAASLAYRAREGAVNRGVLAITLGGLALAAVVAAILTAAARG